MRIERLEIAGFKSFADPVAIGFHPGATAVVGPNGCGKSNIADALCWVLGELGAGTIRARGKDLIFSGSALRSPLGVAEVRLHLSGVTAGATRLEARRPGNGAVAGHAGGTEPPPREVVVTRRVDRSGQSSYEMDGRRSTRREIRRLFAGTGLGAGSYALIEQGRAHDVLTARPEDLRLLVEEAAGLGAYRLNRRESESNLRAAERALERVRERLRELDRHIGKARRDARSAKRMQEAAERVRWLRIAEQAARRDELARRIRDGRGPEADLAAECGRRKESLHAFGLHLEELRRRSTATDAELREATRRLGDLKSRRAEAGALLAEGERAASLRAGQLLRLDAEEGEVRDRIRRRETERARIARRAEEFPGLLEQLVSTAAGLGEARDAAIAGEDESRRALEEGRRERDRLGAAAGGHRLAAAQHEEQRERLAAAGVALAGARRGLDARLEHALEVGSEAGAKRRKQDEETARIAAALREAERVRRAAAAETVAAHDAEQGARRDLDALEARLGSVKALVLSREQLGPGATRLLAAARRQRLALLGAVGEGVEVEDGYERAAERVLGVHRVRVERTADLSRLLDAVEGEEIGPCEVLVSELVDASAAADETPRGSPPDGDRLRDHVTAADAALGAAIPQATVVPDLETALAQFLGRPALYVTRTGASVAPPGVVRLGRGGAGEGFLAARRELAALERRSAESERRLAALSAALATARKRAAAAEEAVSAHREALRRAERHGERLRLDFERSGETVREVRRRLEELAAEVSVHAEDCRRNEEARALAATALAADEERLEQTAGTLARRERALASAEQRRTAAEADWRDADRELTRKKAVAAEVVREARVWEQQAEAEAKRLEQIGWERATLTEEDERWRERRQAALAEAAAAADGASEWAATEKRLSETAEGFRVRLEAAVSASRSRRTELDALEERLAAAAREVSGARSLLDALESEFRRRQRRSLAEAAAGIPPALREKTRDELAAELSSVEREIEELGPVNEIAEARLRELEAERAGPASQLGDVERGIRDGLEAVDRQDRDARRIFQEGFEAVNAGFDAAFRQLFGGGRARLRLVEPKRAPAGEANGAEPPEFPDREAGSVVETGGSARQGVDRQGIEIAAEPPGKKLQSVRLLSGGEKAMAAIAFLIALFRYRPAPFCLLDEVDAPLDDANVQRFAALLGELRQDTQLVVITHNRLTMEACQHLYGVTMEEPGVSRLISVELGAEELEGWIADAAVSSPDPSGLAVH